VGHRQVCPWLSCAKRPEVDNLRAMCVRNDDFLAEPDASCRSCASRDVHCFAPNGPFGA
jgi:hypothetical protein